MIDVKVLLPLCFAGLLVGCQPQSETSDVPELSQEEMRKAENALSSFQVYEGLSIQQFASEPMLINPTNIDIDERGRVWVCEAQNYRGFRNDHPQRAKGDRILILEDQDGDGRADQQKIFYQGIDVNSALGIAKLGEKVYVAASPNLLVFTDENGDDIPDQKDTLFTGLDGVDHDHGVHAVIFGPDGKLYFSFGNEGKQLRLKSGVLARDKYGEVIQEGQSFRQGMIFRCNADGTELEILGHNFRNNYELAVDAYGAIWQSDNDDDGNRATRMNFILDYGNYGFTDQVTGAGWRTPRIGMHEEIPKRHWHLNDPGVVPNLLQTGAGSPTGILVYEGSALPTTLQGQVIHCEPGKNIVRTYPVIENGAGYNAKIIPILESSDSWFRPSDVCAAPDGSILISDWYDEGVGGHLMADIQRGRIYRLHTQGSSAYHPTMPDMKTTTAAAQQLNHVNQSIRFLAYHKVIRASNAVNVLIKLINESSDDRLKARAYWCLASLPRQGMEAARMAVQESNPNLRMTGLRIARQFTAEDQLLNLVESAASEKHMGVLREAALCLRHCTDDRADQIWAKLASQYDGQDRWYLEALGIGADLKPDSRFSAYLQLMQGQDLGFAPDILWRSRSDQVLPYLFELIQGTNDPEKMVRYFRALHFLTPDKVEPYLAKILQGSDDSINKEMLRFTLSSLSPASIRNNPEIRHRVTELLPEIRKSDAWTMIVRNTKISSESSILLDSAIVSRHDNFAREAINLSVELGGHQLLQSHFDQADLPVQNRLIYLAAYLRSADNRDWLDQLMQDSERPKVLRHQAAKSLCNDWNGMETIITRLEQGQIDDADAAVFATFLTQAWRNDVRQRAIEWIKKTKGITPINLVNLAAEDGDATAGEGVFQQYCQGCHIVNGTGQNFGPDLTSIGDKLGKDGLLSAIVYPSMGIGFGYEGFEIKTKDGQIYHGFIESETEHDLTLRMMGGLTQRITHDKIMEKIPLDESLMTADLHQLMTQEELLDLIEYLSTLHGKNVL